MGVGALGLCSRPPRGTGMEVSARQPRPGGQASPGQVGSRPGLAPWREAGRLSPGLSLFPETFQTRAQDQARACYC